MRIVHFSDIHFGLWPERFIQALFDKRILGLLNYGLRRRRQAHRYSLKLALQRIIELQPRLVVCTGDVTSISSEREFAKASKALAPLLDSSDFDFIYLPGNHDHYVKDQHCQKAFRRAFEELNSGRWKLTDLPAIYDGGSYQMAVCDECRPTNIFLSSGYLDPALERYLKQWLENPSPGVKRILAGHYPTRDGGGRPLSRRRRLNNAEVIRQALKSGHLDAYLCGHIHQPFLHREESGGLEVCAGALTWNGMINVLDLPADSRQPIEQFWEPVETSLTD